MASEDEIEKLLREIASQDSPQFAPASRKDSDLPAQQRESSSSGRVAYAVAGGVIMGVGGVASGLLLPGLTMISTGVGAAVGAFLIALISGPPRWFSR